MKPLHGYVTAILLALTLIPMSLSGQEIYDYETESPAVKPKARELYFYKMRAYPFGKIPQGARLNAIEQTEKMSRYSDSYVSLAESSWRQIGPTKVGGRVRSIAVHPTDGNTLWVGAADGGVWKSTDAGANWEPLMQNNNAIAMGALAVDPNNPSILYAGTGEMSSNVDAYTGAGMFKSEDGGNTWRVIGLTNVGSFARIVVHPNNSNVVWAAATKNNSGFYKSTDAGNSWRRILESATADITVNPQNPDELWIGLMTNGIRHSIDGGETFTTRNNGLGALGTTLNRISIQVAPSNPSIVYALAYETAGASTTFSRIYKSQNSGRNWQSIFDNQPNFLGNGAGSQGWYNNVISVHPEDPNIVVAGGVSMVRTTNGGETWNSAGTTVHPDHHAMMYDPTNPNRLYEGNDGGMYVSQNAGASWTNISDGLSITQFYAMAVDQREDNVTYGGTQDNGTLTTNSEFYGDVLGGDGFYVAIDYTQPNLIYAEREHGQIYRRTRSGSIWTGPSIDRGLPTGEADVNWSAPLVLDPKDPNRLYSGRHRLYVTFNPRDNGNSVSWLPVSPEMSGNISAIGISPHSSDVIFIGSARGVVMRTTTATEEWTNLSFGHGLPNRAVTDFAFSPTDPDIVYVSFSGFYTEHVYRSTDKGETWESISSGLPDIPINALAIHPTNESILFAGSDLGMFITVDGGSSWTVYNQGMPRVAVIDLEVHDELKVLRAATHGRSMFEIGIGGEAPEIAPSITSPHGGEVWVGTTQNVIAWGGIHDDRGVRVQYSLDDGQNWRELGYQVKGNTFRWHTVNKESFVARIRVISVTNPEISATSNTFTIEPFDRGAVLTTDSKPTVTYGIASDGKYLWTTDFNSNTLLKLDPETLDAVEEVKMGSAAGDSLFTDITYYPERNSLFVHRLNSTITPSAGGWLVEVSKTGEVLGLWRSPCGYPIGLAWLGAKNPDVPFLYVADRDGAQPIYFFDPAAFDPQGTDIIPTIQTTREIRIESGPRGAAADYGNIWQIITDFTGGTLQSATAISTDIDNLAIGKQPAICSVDLSSPLATSINARGVELDTVQNALWISDFAGNLYKVASCNTHPGISDSGDVPASVPTTGSAIPAGLELGQNSPNPFSTSTDISFTLPSAMQVRVQIYDMAGRLITTLADDRFEAGTQSIPFNSRSLPAGVYRYSLVLQNGAQVAKTMVLVK